MEFAIDLSELDINKIVLKESDENSADMIKRHHGYVPTTRYVGRQCNYKIECQGYIIGFTGIGSAVMSMGDRDRFIGWTKQQRLSNIVHVGNNWRYTLVDNLPKNTGSKVLSLVVDRAREDWKKRYGDELVLLETMVEAPRTGTVYLASGWVKVGKTIGTQYEWKHKDSVLKGDQIVKRGFKIADKVDEDKVKVISGNATPKEILLKPINKRWKKILCENPKCEDCVSFSKQRECSTCSERLTRSRIRHFNEGSVITILADDEEWDGVVKMRGKHA